MWTNGLGVGCTEEVGSGHLHPQMTGMKTREQPEGLYFDFVDFADFCPLDFVGVFVRSLSCRYLGSLEWFSGHECFAAYRTRTVSLMQYYLH